MGNNTIDTWMLQHLFQQQKCIQSVSDNVVVQRSGARPSSAAHLSHHFLWCRACHWACIAHEILACTNRSHSRDSLAPPPFLSFCRTQLHFYHIKSSVWSGCQCNDWSSNLESVVNVSFVDSPTNPLYTIVLLAGLPFGLTVASWKKVEYFNSLFSSRDLSKALRQGAAAVMLFCATFKSIRCL